MVCPQGVDVVNCAMDSVRDARRWTWAPTVGMQDMLEDVRSMEGQKSPRFALLWKADSALADLLATLEHGELAFARLHLDLGVAG